MAITATRIGSAPITIDWSNFIRIPPALMANGKAPLSLPPDREELSNAWNTLKARFDSGEIGFYDSCIKKDLSQIEAVQAMAARILESGQFNDCLFLGIGGSSLGPISLLSALREKVHAKMKFHFAENPDPIEWNQTIQALNPNRTLVVIVTKSGTTFETIAQALLALDWLGKERWKSHVVAITDPKNGDLRAFVDQQQIPSLSIAPSLGGRFSVFSPVGLFPAALAGLDPVAILQGASQVRDYTEKAPFEKNPLFTLGVEFIRHFRTRPIHVCMPYSTPLRSVGDWFAQLWGESLGKDRKGFTPLAALGATDQHSILQLLRDGPDDKVTWFITIDQVKDAPKIPGQISGIDFGKYPAFNILKNHTLHDLLRTEYQAISRVLTRQNRPHLTIQIDSLDERSLGALYFAFSVLTAMTGTLWEVNPFDQPGVEEGKVYIKETLERNAAGYLASEEDPNSPVNRLRRHRTDVEPADPGADSAGNH